MGKEMLTYDAVFSKLLKVGSVKEAMDLLEETDLLPANRAFALAIVALQRVIYLEEALHV